MKFYYPVDSKGNPIGFKTPESQVYDKNGKILTDKLESIQHSIDSLTSGGETTHVSEYTDVRTKTVSIDSWSSDSTYAYVGYNYAANVNVSGIKSNSIPDIILKPTNDLDIIAPFATTSEGTLTLYAISKPESEITIDRISFR